MFILKLLCVLIILYWDDDALHSVTGVIYTRVEWCNLYQS